MKTDLNFKLLPVLLGGLCLSLNALAQESEPLDVAHLEPLSIIGSKEDLLALPGQDTSSIMI